ncbi:MAG: hypothetical protein OHK93_008440 [Ramalina farinacea]|uniref:Uncharacterized protein n=1 Tax=Ramalina farinacea TaxID=258253 RepID=A0AA43QMF3_9LECA|nr:hypothetical protein [Ramalina farinacea]
MPTHIFEILNGALSFLDGGSSLNPNIPDINATQQHSDSAPGSCTREHLSGALKDADGEISAETSPGSDKIQGQTEVEMKEVKKEIEKTKKDKEKVMMENDRVKSENEELKKENEGVKREKEQFKKESEDVTKENNEVRRENEEVLKEHDALRFELSRLQQREAKLASKNKALQECVCAWKRQSDVLRNTNEELQENLHTASLEIGVRKNSVDDLLEAGARQETKRILLGLPKAPHRRE